LLAQLALLQGPAIATDEEAAAMPATAGAVEVAAAEATQHQYCSLYLA